MSSTKFVSIEPDPQFSSSNQVLILKTNGFDLDNELDPQLYIFRMEVYSLTKKPATLTNILGPVNAFFRTLPFEHQKDIALALVHLNYLINYEINDPDSYQRVVEQCGVILEKLDEYINLCDSLRAYVLGHIYMEDLSGHGFRPHDKASMTFNQNELTDLTTITMLCKLMSFIFAAISVKHKLYGIAGEKEQDCAYILLRLFRKHFFMLMVKFDHYVRSLVTNTLKTRKDAISAYHGLEDVPTTAGQKASVLVRKLVTEDIMNGNVTKYISVGATSGTDSKYRNAKNKLNVHVNERNDRQEEGNTSKLEDESKPSKYGIDFVICQRYRTQEVWEEYVKKHDLDPKIVEEAALFYHGNPTASTTMATVLMSNFFGEAFGGGKVIQHLKLPMYYRLAATMQYILLTYHRSIPLAHAITMNPIDTEGMVFELDPEDALATKTWQASGEYRICKQTFVSGFGERSWENKLKEIVTDLTTIPHVYNTAPVFWDIMRTLGIEDKSLSCHNGDFIREHGRLIREICKLLHFIYTN